MDRIYIHIQYPAGYKIQYPIWPNNLIDKAGYWETFASYPVAGYPSIQISGLYQFHEQYI